MLKKDYRILTRKEFLEIKDRGEMYSTPLFGVLVLKSNDGKKFGFIISKKISKRAVDRNRIKRFLSEGVRKSLSMLDLDIKIVFLAKKSLLDAQNALIQKEIESCFKKLNEKNNFKTDSLV